MMNTLITPSGRVHWVGTGMSTGSGLGLVEEAASELAVWGRTREKATACLERLGLQGKASARAFSPDTLAAEVRQGDVVVSMLPAAEHPSLARLCVRRGAHFVNSSYTSPEMVGLAREAQRAGLVVLTESGLDPGIDHLLTHELVRLGRGATEGATNPTVSFTSYCGSFPAQPNDFRYRFSWAPKGVLTALRTTARYVEAGREQVADRPYKAVRGVTLGGELFEVYPNRDSVPFIESYRFPKSWQVETFIRGTVRLEGWTDAWQGVFTEVESATDEGLTLLAGQLAEQYPATKEDHDRVVMFVTLEIVTDDCRWSGRYTMDVCGDERENATPRLVSVAMAGGIADVLAARMGPGLHRAAADAGSVRRWLDFLGAHGIVCHLSNQVEPLSA